MHKVNDILKKCYTKVGFEISREISESISFKLDDVEVLQVKKDDIAAYSAFLKSRYTNKPRMCSICSLEYREHLIGPLSKGTDSWLSETPMVSFKQNEETDPLIQILPCSLDFFYYFRTEEDFLEQVVSEVKRKMKETAPPYNFDARNVYRPATIRVSDLSANTIIEALDISSKYIDACRFYLSHKHNIDLRLCNNWRDSLYLQNFYHPKSGILDNLELPAYSINSNLVNYYIRTQSYINPEDVYLGYYRILEYFFHSTVEKEMKGKLTLLLNDPGFTPDESNVGKVVSLVKEYRLDYRRDIDAFKLLLKSYLDEERMIGFFRKFHSDINYEYFTKK